MGPGAVVVLESQGAGGFSPSRQIKRVSPEAREVFLFPSLSPMNRARTPRPLPTSPLSPDLYQVTGAQVTASFCRVNPALLQVLVGTDRYK